MPYVSDFIGRPVVDVDGKKIGKLRDLLASRPSDTSHPQIVALEIHGDGEIFFTPIESVAALISLAIPLTARILQVVDLFDAFTTQRPYKPAFSLQQSFAVMREETAKGWWDARLVETFIALVEAERLGHHAGCR